MRVRVFNQSINDDVKNENVARKPVKRKEFMKVKDREELKHGQNHKIEFLRTGVEMIFGKKVVFNLMFLLQFKIPTQGSR